MIKAVIFDLDNTLYSYDKCSQYAYQQLQLYMAHRNIPKHIFDGVFTTARNEVKQQLPYQYAARHNRLLYFQRCAEMLRTEYDIDMFQTPLEMYDVYWNNFLEQMAMYDGAGDFLDNLRYSRISTAICTDMTVHIQFRKICRLGIQDKIDFIVSSEEVGYEKPSPVIYNMTVQKLGVQPDECIYIGDDYQRDIVGAVGAGMKPIHFSSQKAGDVPTFDNYKEIEGYFETLRF